ncbi:MAG: hypothetical protein GC160_30235 [Acidobacteria bacterium]|nr:hypothetical protein [Acidobacteriota bacterium]
MSKKKAAKSEPSMTFDELFELRERTEVISQFLEKELTETLATLWPLLAAKRVFGQYISPRETVKAADEAFSELETRFNEVRSTPYGLMSEMAKQDVASAAGGMVLSPWQYPYVVGEAEASKTVQVTSPNKWYFTYKSEYTLPQISQALREKQDLWPGPTREFVVNALAMDMVLARSPGLVRILESLGFKVVIETNRTMGKLPLVTIESNLRAALPPDELLLKATRFSGVSAFHELIDAAAIEEYENPFVTRLQALFE